MSVDWGQALATGVAAGAGAAAGEFKSQQDDAQWLEREKVLDKIHRDAQNDNERFLMGLKPPETRKLNVSGKSGPAIQQQEWIPPAKDEAAGHFANVGDETPDINFERLDETTRHNKEAEELRGAADQARADANVAKIDLARTKLEQAASKKNGTETQPKPYTFTVNGKPTTRYGSFINGQFQPALDETGQPIQGDKFKPSVFEEKTEAKNAPPPGQRDAVGPSFPKDPYNDATRKPVSERGGMFGSDNLAPVFVDPAAGGADRPAGTMAQLRPQKAPTSTPASARGVAAATAGHGKVVRTGTNKQGQRVAMYEDGTVAPI